MLHPFGSGLQYNTWGIDALTLSQDALKASDIEATRAAEVSSGAPPAGGQGCF
jgi:hypothetical protein